MFKNSKVKFTFIDLFENKHEIIRYDKKIKIIKICLH